MQQLKKMVFMLVGLTLVWISFVMMYSNHNLQFVQIRNTADIEISQDIKVQKPSSRIKIFPTRNKKYSERLEHGFPTRFHSQVTDYPSNQHEIVSQSDVVNKLIKDAVLIQKPISDERHILNEFNDKPKRENANIEKQYIELTPTEIKQREEWIKKAKFTLFLRKKRNGELLEYIKTNFNANSGPETGIDMVDDYFRERNQRVNPHDYRFIYNGHKICNGEQQPWLLIMVLSVANKIRERAVIRRTWGSVARGKQWPGTKRTYDGVKIMFIFGKSENARDDEILVEEKGIYGDIVQADFVDSYNHLTTKVMMGIKWTTKFCPGVKFLLKVDDDSFIHVPNAVKTFKRTHVPPNGVIIGNGIRHPVVLRVSKWGLPYEVFPFVNYPTYANGQAYAISGNILKDIFTTGEYMPYVFIEDAFLTGIVRTVIGATITPLIGFPTAFMNKAEPCSFHNNIRVAATNLNAASMREIWLSLYKDTIKDCYKCLNEHC